MKMLIKLSSLLLLSALAAGGFIAYQQYQSFLGQPIQLENESTSFEIKSGNTIRQVAKRLREEGFLQPDTLIRNDRLFEAHAHIKGLANQLKAGEFMLKPGMLPDDLLKLFISGKTLQYQVRFIEGRTYREIIPIIRNHPHIKQTLSDADWQEIMPLLGAEAGTHPEGWFLPDTYFFPRNTSDLDILKRSYQAMKDYLTNAWDKRTINPHIAEPYQALILASIVEKETGVADERPLIARVFLNRFDKDMKLQTDPTVIYGMGDAYDGNIRKRDLRTDTPYNTYTRKGLPPTPIALPGKAAIDAVFHPAEGDALFFVATGKGDGRHFFSKTYKEHRRAVIKYQLNGNSARYQGDK